MKDKENSREIQFKEELVRKAKNGDTKAFSLLYAGVCKEMYKFALYMMKHTEDAEDAVSEEEERMILSYSVFAGYGSEEIAQMLEMNATTVRSKKSRALGKMRKMLEAG